MSNAIVAALLQLDPKNDAHWTADGAPALEAVRLFSGDDKLTRVMVTGAAPGLKRAGFATWAETVVEKPPPPPEYPPGDVGLEGEELELATAEELEARIVAAREEVERCSLAKAKAEGDHRRAEAALDELLEQKTREFPATDPVVSAQQFIRSQHEQRVLAATGGTLAQYNASKLDQDMRGKRPTSQPPMAAARA